MKILFASAEVVPFAKVGGLADVAGSLPLALHGLDHDVRVIMPKYLSVTQGPWERWRTVPGVPVPMAGWTSGCALEEARLPGSDVPIYFVEHHDYFSRPFVYGPPGGSYEDNLERLTFFCRAVMAVLEPLNWTPDVIHLNDWHTTLLSVYLQGGAPATVFTIHNLGPAYQGTFPADKLPFTGLREDFPGTREFVREGQLNLAAAGLSCADMINAVSPTYAKEIASPEFSGGLADLVKKRGSDVWGILNGIDYEVWNPATDAALAAPFDAGDPAGKAVCKAALQREAGLPEDPEVPVLAMVTRLDSQKGFDLLAPLLPDLQGLQLIVLGTGAPEYEALLRDAAATRSDVAAWLKFDNRLASLIYGGADLFLMPSRYEPCGLGQMIAMRYGTLPIVRATGGLADSVIEKGRAGNKQNGFVFADYDAGQMAEAIARAVALYTGKPKRWAEVRQNALEADFTWTRSAQEYVKLYQAAVAKV